MNMTGLLSEAAAGKEDDTIFREHVVYLRRKIACVNMGPGWLGRATACAQRKH